jgi:hypothetical protein
LHQQTNRLEKESHIMPKSTVTAAEVRAFLSADPKRLASLSPEARKTVEPNAEGKFPKGRLHKEAIKAHNSRRKTRQYVLGATRDAANAQREAAKAARAALVAQGVKVGTRGPLPKVAPASAKG